MHKYVKASRATEINARQAGPALALYPEFERLAKQRCPYCSGYGHSGNDCPTDAKISHLRGGVREQNAFIQKCRKEAREASGMKNVTGFSLLSAQEIGGPRKRKRVDVEFDNHSMNDQLFAKRRKFL